MSDNDVMVKCDEEFERKVFFQEEDPRLIWEDVIHKDLFAFKNLSDYLVQRIFNSPIGYITDAVAIFVYNVLYRYFGHFINESDYFADQCGSNLSRHRCALIQRLYTLSHFGCSTACVWDANDSRTKCLRSLDWEGANLISKATRIFQFVDKSMEPVFQAAGIAGMVGLLTGVKKNFSVSVNYAPWDEPSVEFESDPTFLVRKLFQDPEVSTFDDALSKIKKWKTGAPVFITLCGSEKDQACAIEIGSEDNYFCRWSQNGLLVQTNHFDSKSPFVRHNPEMHSYPVDESGAEINNWYFGKLLPGSTYRREELENLLLAGVNKNMSIEELLISTYKIAPIWNYETAHWVLMDPALSNIDVWIRKT